MSNPTPSHSISKAGHDAESLLVIESRPGWHAIDLAELWRYRELLWFLAMRDVKVRYKQTALGAFWAILQPFLKMVVFTLFFSALAKSNSAIPYALFLYCGLLPWQLFEFMFTQSANSIIANERLISKIYFPRLLIPFSSAVVGLVDFACAFLVLVGLFIYYDIAPGWPVLLLPLFLLLTVTTAMAVGLWLSALTAIYQDFRYTLSFLAQLWFFATPIVFQSDDVKRPVLRWVLALNPMTGVIEGFRWALLPGSEPPKAMLLFSVVGTLLLLLGGMLYFRRMERTFADNV